MKVFDSTVAVKSRRAMTKAERKQAHHAASSSAPIAAAAASPAMATKASCKPGPLDRQRLDPGVAVDQRLEQRLGPAFGQLEHPFGALAPGAGRHRRAPRPVLGRGSAAGRSAEAGRAPRRPRRRTRPCPAAMIAIRSHSRSAWAMTWVEKMIVAPLAACVADQLLELALVDRVEPGERLVEDDQPRLVDDRAEQLDGLRHAFGQGCGSAVSPIAKAVLVEQLVGAPAPFGERQAAQRAHEGDRLARVHRRVEAALLGQVADLGRRLDAAGRGRARDACPRRDR